MSRPKIAYQPRKCQKNVPPLSIRVSSHKLRRAKKAAEARARAKRRADRRAGIVPPRWSPDQHELRDAPHAPWRRGQ